MDLIQLDNVLSVLMEFASEFEDEYKQSLARSGKYTTEYNLIDSVKTQVQTADGGYEVTMTLNDYWKYVEGGAKGRNSSPAGAKYPAHFPPLKAILNWIQIKPIIPKPDELGRTPSEDQLAYLIGRKILLEGIEPSPDLENTRTALIARFRDRIEEALGHDLENYIGKVFSSSQ